MRFGLSLGLKGKKTANNPPWVLGGVLGWVVAGSGNVPCQGARTVGRVGATRGIVTRGILEYHAWAPRVAFAWPFFDHARPSMRYRNIGGLEKSSSQTCKVPE